MTRTRGDALSSPNAIREDNSDRRRAAGRAQTQGYACFPAFAGQPHKDSDAPRGEVIKDRPSRLAGLCEGEHTQDWRTYLEPNSESHHSSLCIRGRSAKRKHSDTHATTSCFPQELLNDVGHEGMSYA